MNRSFWALVIAVMLSAAVLPSVATASECASSDFETVYVTGGMNIRASASVSSRVVASARAGDSFTVVESRAGARWCWLRINQGWMANTSRVQSTRPVQRDATPPLAQQPASRSDIDNCCFVDRQCVTNKEWVDGYWAYQNNECSAPTEPPASNVEAPPRQTSVAPSEANNCCHIGWDCQTEAEWIHGYNAYQSNQCENPGVAILGSDRFRAVILEALRQLKERSPYWYIYTIDGLDNIREESQSGIWVSSRTADVSWSANSYVISRADIGAVAALLVHEACHVHRGRAGLQSGGLVGERDCLQKEIQVLDLLGTSPGRRNWLQEVLDNINSRSYQWWH
ncbi:MAG: SH3 domain-containing protein [Chloroflexi bacterium]|nr:SH3 domain-containing protein [Chloroflexota bacterium]